MSVEQLCGENEEEFAEMAKEEGASQVEKAVDEVRGGNIAPREEIGPSGKTLMYSATMLSNGDRLTSCYDITEQKKAQFALELAKQKAERDFADLRATMDAMRMGVALLDENLNVLFVNKANYRMWNWRQEDFTLGEPFRNLINLNRHNGVYDVDDAAWEKYVAGRLAEVAAGDIEPREFVRKDGSELVYSCTALSGGKRLVCYFDISAQKNAERTLIEAER